MIEYKKLNKKELVELLIKSDNQYYNSGKLYISFSYINDILNGKFVSYFEKNPGVVK